MTNEGSHRWTAWLARVVTYGLLAVLAFGVWNHVEAWPVTSYRLFSGVRTGSSAGYQLVAVDRDGTESRVRLTGDTVATTSHQFRMLRTLDPVGQRAKVRTWLQQAGMDPEEVSVVRLEWVTRALDPDGGPSTETGRRVVVTVEVAG